MADLAVIVPAAGLSSRFGSPKLRATLGGRSVIARSIDAFRGRPDVRAIIIATRDGARQDLPDDLQPAGDDPVIRLCAGGASRAESVRNALAAVPEAIEWVAVHDAARPLVSQALIDRTLEGAVARGAAVPALSVALTIKRAQGRLPAPVIETVPRHELWAMQTPQVMRRRDLAAAFARCPIPLDQVTDDVQLLELAGLPAWLVEGEERNLKITTPLDLRLAELLLES